MLSIPATNRACGVFDNLHGFPDGRAFSDDLKQSTGRYYGTAGPVFTEKLLGDDACLPELYARICNLPDFYSQDGVEGRAAALLGLIALSGEKATEYGLTGWKEGEALDACIELFAAWREYRGQGQTETRQILKSICHFIERHGDSRFSEIGNSSIADENGIDERPIVHDRAGYWRDTEKGRIFMFNSSALQEAAHGYDLKFILSSLRDAGWIAEHDSGRNSKKTKIKGRSLSLYWLIPKDDGD